MIVTCTWILILRDTISAQIYNANPDFIERYERLVKLRYGLCQEERQLPRDRQRTERDVYSTCCGHCSTEYNCYSFGTCCVDMFESLDEAQHYMPDTGLVYTCLNHKFSNVRIVITIKQI